MNAGDFRKHNLFGGADKGIDNNIYAIILKSPGFGP